MISAVIIDDELLSRESLEFLIGKLEDIQVVASFETALSSKPFLESNHVDVIFLDIEMPGLSGMDFLATMNNLPSIILTTSNPDYALEAFEYQVVDYLIKPIGLKRFNEALNRIREKKEQSDDKSNEIYVRADGKFIRINLQELVYVETMDDYVVLHLDNTKKHVVHSTLSKMNDRLPQASFQKVHRSYVVNLGKISAVEEGQLSIGDRTIPISRAYRPILKSRLKLS